MSRLMNTYNRLPIALQRGDGAWVWDTDGNRYLDALAGIAVNGLGHGHPRLVKAIAEQAAKLIHASNNYRVPQQEALAERLCVLSGMQEVFFCSSGAEANECAIKLARMYGHQRGIELPTIIVMERAWHGRTIATLSATGNRQAQAGFEPLCQGFVRVPYNDIAAIEQVAAHQPSIVAVLFEVIQGEGGIRQVDIAYQRALKDLCERQNWLFMVDEVQSGIGRTGEWFAFQHSGALPDVMPLAKGLGSGVPIGACLAAGKAVGLFKPGNHGTTFGGGPLACTAALTTLAIIEDEDLRGNARRVGELIRAGLMRELAGVRGVVEVRGRGLMLGIELDRPCADLARRALGAGLLINVTQENVVRLLPPLVIDAAQAQLLVDTLASLIREFLSQPLAA